MQPGFYLGNDEVKDLNRRTLLPPGVGTKLSPGGQHIHFRIVRSMINNTEFSNGAEPLESHKIVSAAIAQIWLDPPRQQPESQRVR